MLIDVHTHLSCKKERGVFLIKSYHAIQSDLGSCYFSYGLHPWYLNEMIDETIFDHPLCLAVGECGLDTLKSPFDLDKQKQMLTYQLKIAAKKGKPVILHVVKAVDALLSVLREFSQLTYIWHGFPGKKAWADQVKNFNFYFSFGPYGLQGKDWQMIPLERIFVETDESNHSIAWFYDQMAKRLGMAVEELEQKIEENARRVFGNIW